MRMRRKNKTNKMAYQTFQQEFMQIPVVTRVYSTACVFTTTAVVNNIFLLLHRDTQSFPLEYS